MMVVTILAIASIVGLAGYCMVCERLADNRDRVVVPATEPRRVVREPVAPMTPLPRTLAAAPAGDWGVSLPAAD
jgi:hypothetical protein